MRLNSACKIPPATEAPSSGFDGLPSGSANDTGYVTANGVWTFWQSATQDEGYSYGGAEAFARASAAAKASAAELSFATKAGRGRHSRMRCAERWGAAPAGN